jgi:anti-anti-sigma factor
MSIMIEQSSSLTIVRILTDSVDALSAKEIAQASGQLHAITVLDFNKVLFINSAGISALLKLVIEARKGGKKLYAINVTAHHRKVFEMVDMLRYMPVTTLQELAMNAAQ